MTDKTMYSDQQAFDAVIIGAGPAGVSCAVWLARLGFRPVVLEAGDVAGGLCHNNPYPDPWNVSLPDSTGEQIAKNLALSLEQADVTVRFQFRVARVMRESNLFRITDVNGDVVKGRFVVLATGVRARGLADPGTAVETSPAVLIGPGADIVAQDFRDKRVAILGGGDNAFENALYVTERGAKSVHIYARTISAQHQFVRRIAPADITQGSYEVDTAALTVDGEAYDLILVFYGWEPNSSFVDDLALQADSRGYLYTHPKTAQTSVDGVYAVGEVALRMHPCVVTAMADGVVAAKAIQARIETDAVLP